MRFFILIKRKLSSAMTLSIADWGYFLQAYFLLGIARFAVLVLPFRWIAKTLGKKQQETVKDRLLHEQKEIVLTVSRNIKLASRYTPWSSNCLAQAIVANHLLKAHKVSNTVYFGIAKKARQSSVDKAHAWVRCGKFYVVGGDGSVSHSIVATFATETPDI